MLTPLSASSPALSQQPRGRLDEDSDSDWDDDDSDDDSDDDFVYKKIKNIRIKPAAQVTPGKIGAPVDELKAVVSSWKSMGNINLVKPNSRRSQYQAQGSPPPIQKPPQLQPPPPPIPPRLPKTYSTFVTNPLGPVVVRAPPADAN
jgi:hypothetical protein